MGRREVLSGLFFYTIIIVKNTLSNLPGAKEFQHLLFMRSNTAGTEGDVEMLQEQMELVGVGDRKLVRMAACSFNGGRHGNELPLNFGLACEAQSEAHCSHYSQANLENLTQFTKPFSGSKSLCGQ